MSKSNRIRLRFITNAEGRFKGFSLSFTTSITPGGWKTFCIIFNILWTSCAQNVLGTINNYLNKAGSCLWPKSVRLRPPWHESQHVHLRFSSTHTKTINRFIKKRHSGDRYRLNLRFLSPKKSRLCENREEDKSRDNYLRFQTFYMNIQMRTNPLIYIRFRRF